MVWRRFPQVNLANLPTPLEEMKAVSRDFPCQVYMKRDDLTGLAFGGNKVRKLEFLLAEALDQGAKAVITEGGVQSNHARMTAAASRKLGLEPVLVLGGRAAEEKRGNLLLDDFLGARVYFCPPSDRKKTMKELGERYEQEGLKPYIIPTGGSTPLGTLGYLRAAEEIKKQEQVLGLEFDYILAPLGSGGTHAGLLLGKYYYGLRAKILGIAVERRDFRPLVEDLFSQSVGMLGMEMKMEKGDFMINLDYVGPGYGYFDEATASAIRYFARQEGILMGPVYTGKAGAGLLDLLEQGFFPPGSKILFIHTGGTPELFAWNEFEPGEVDK